MRRKPLAVATVLASLVLPAPPAAAAAPDLGTTVIKDGLSTPWDVAFAPDGKMLVTERPGRVRV